jgi:FkbM family methyltransferase
VKYGSRSDRQFLVDQVIGLALQSRGYNNYRSHDESGETHLVRTLGTIGALGTCIDVGANQGSFSTLMLEAGAEHVIAFEPHPAHRPSLDELAVRFPGRFTIVEAAAGASNGSADLLFNKSALSHASLAEEVNRISYVNNRESARVRVTALNDELRDLPIPPIDFLKIDTEGYEEEVLLGASELLKTSPPQAVLIEFNQHQLVRGHSLLSLSRHLNGYQSFQLLRGSSGVRVTKPHTPEDNIFHFSNFVFVRDDVATQFLAESNRSPEMR